MDLDFEVRDPFPDFALPFPDLDPPPLFPREACEVFARFFLEDDDPVWVLEDEGLGLDLGLDFLFPLPFPEEDGAEGAPDSVTDDGRRESLP